MKTEPTWDIVTTAKAPTEMIHRFLAYHLSVGVRHIYLFLDAPDDPALSGLQTHPQVSAFHCDDDYWTKQLGRDRPETHPRRQIVNATFAYGLACSDWIAHIDIDEFIISPRRISDLLHKVDATTVALRMMPAELLYAPESDKTHHQFKLAVPRALRETSLLSDLYPTFGDQLATGLVSHATGKTIARTGMSIARLGIHRLLLPEGRPTHPALKGLFLGHLHAESFEHFYQHLIYRLSHGSYASSKDRTGKSLYNLLLSLSQQGPEALKSFYNEVCSARPLLVESLRRHKLIEQVKIDFEGLAQEYFP